MIYHDTMVSQPSISTHDYIHSCQGQNPFCRTKNMVDGANVLIKSSIRCLTCTFVSTFSCSMFALIAFLAHSWLVTLGCTCCTKDGLTGKWS